MNKFRKRFLISKRDELVILKTDDISFILKEPDSVKAYTRSGERYTLPLTLSEAEEQLDPEKFFRLNRQCIANVEGIKKINVFFNSKLTVYLHGLSGEGIIISKERAALFKEWLDR